MNKKCGYSLKERVLDQWRGCYFIVIPTFFCLVYIILLILIQKGILQYKYFWESESFNSALESIITFVSIILSFFGVLLPILIQGKENSETIKFFFSVVDKRYFLNRVKVMIISGFGTITCTCLLFFSDIFYNLVCSILSSACIWIFFYFISSSYRFISLLLMMFVTEKKMGYKGDK